MRTLIVLLAAVAMAASATAEVDRVRVVDGGKLQSPWYSAYSTGGILPYYETTAPDGTPAVNHSEPWGAWTEIRANGAIEILNFGAFAALEYDVYFASNGGATSGARQDAMYIDVNGDGGWTYKWQNPTDTWVNGVHYSGMDQYVAPLDTWVHVRIDLMDNIFPEDPYGAVTPLLVGDMISTIRLYGHWPNTNDAYISEMAFTDVTGRLIPEPTSIVLLGLGGLTLIRRKP